MWLPLRILAKLNHYPRRIEFDFSLPYLIQARQIDPLAVRGSDFSPRTRLATIEGSDLPCWPQRALQSKFLT